MKHVRRLWSRIGIAAVTGAAVAAGTAFAYERTEEAPHASLLLAADQTDPGIDYIITGPVPGKKARAGSATSSTADPARPLRYRVQAQ